MDADLGPVWELAELTVFFAEYEDQDWERMAARLDNRTAAMCEGLYEQHKGYLSLPDANARTLATIIQDTYGSDGDAVASTRSKRRSSRKRKRFDEEDYDRGASGDEEGGDSEPASKRRKRNRRLFAESPKKSKGSPKKQKEPAKRTRAAKGRRPAAPPSPSKRGANPPENIAIRALDVEDIAALSSIPGACRHLHSDDPSGRVNARLMHCFSAKVRRWALYEWFYAGIDMAYFGNNEFQECLNQLGLESITKLTRAEWSYVKTVLGKPRRLSAAFLLEERAKLEKNREDVRQLQAGKMLESEADEFLQGNVPAPLVVGQRVTARHPGTKQLHTGSVLTIDTAKHSALVQFDRKELGVEPLPDIAIMPHDEADAPPIRALPASPRAAGTPDMRRTGQAMFYGSSLAAVLRLLNVKKTLVEELQEMNNQAETIVAFERPAYPEHFQQHYAWLMEQLEVVNKQISPDLARLRVAEANLRAKRPAMKKTIDPLFDPLFIQEKSRADARALMEATYKRLVAANLMPAHQSNRASKRVEPIITACISMLFCIQACADRGGYEHLPPRHISTLLESALQDFRPLSPSNAGLFRDLEVSVASVKTSLSGGDHVFL